MSGILELFGARPQGEASREVERKIAEALYGALSALLDAPPPTPKPRLRLVKGGAK